MWTNENRLEEMYRCFCKHMQKGHFLQIDQWMVRIYDDVRYCVEETLVSAELTPAAYIFPCGSMTCGCCNKPYDMKGKEAMAFWDDDGEVMVCFDCRLLFNYSLLPMNVNAIDLDLEEFQRELSYMNMDIQDTRPALYQIRYERMCDVAEKLANTIGGVFLNNMKLADIRERFLAKRVIRRLQRAVERRRRNMLFRLLYNKAHMGLHGALCYAKSVVF